MHIYIYTKKISIFIFVTVTGFSREQSLAIIFAIIKEDLRVELPFTRNLNSQSWSIFCSAAYRTVFPGRVHRALVSVVALDDDERERLSAKEAADSAKLTSAGARRRTSLSSPRVDSGEYDVAASH